LTLTDGGAQGLFNISTTGALLSLVNSGTGFQVKTSSTAITGRSIAVSGSGLSISNGDGISGNPTVSLTGQVLNLANASFNGFMVLTSAGAVTTTTLVGTSNQISITNPTGVGNPNISIADNAILPGTGAVTIPQGTTGQQPVAPQVGMFRYDTTLGAYFGYSGGAWRQFSLSGGVTEVDTGTGLTGGPIVGTGTISIADTTVTAGSYGSTTQVGTFTVNAQGQLTSASNVTISASGIGAVTTINGTANEITASGASTVTLSLPSALTFTGKTVTGGTFNMTSATVGSDTVTTNTATQTLTNKSISGSTNTFTNIPNSGLTNSSITLGTTNIALGGTSLAPAGLTSVTVTADPTLALQLTTKQYVDGLVATGLTYHQPVQAATTASLASTTGGTVTYNNGTAGVGATITLSVALTVLDGYTLANTNRVLIKNEVNQAYNGVYTWATGGTVLTRATDANTYGTGIDQLSQNDYFFTQNGTVNKGTSFVVTTVGTITFGTTAITFAEFSSSLVYTGGTGITVAGTVISITNTAVTAGAYGSATQVGTFTVNAQGQLTLAGNTTVTPAVGSITGLGTGVATALAVNVGSAGAFVVNGGALGTPSSGTVTNLTGTASININGTVGATTATTGAFTTISASGVITSTVATGTAPFTVASTTTVTNLGATNTVNTAVTANSTNATNYLTFVSATSGNLGQLVNSSITCNPSTGAITGGITGGTF
jgi:hypothetical protein